MTAGTKVSGRKWASWQAPLAINVLLGIPAIVPIFLVYYVAANWPLAALGITEREPTENDGALVWVLILGPILIAFGVIWWLANWPLWRRTLLVPSKYWILSMAATVAPTFTLVIVGWGRN